MGITYGYARISRPQQSIELQIRNIKAEYPDAIILLEAFTGTKMDRPEWIMEGNSSDAKLLLYFMYVCIC